MQAILPTVDAHGHRPKHDALILFEPAAATPTNWPVNSLTDKHGKQWQFVRLNGETIHFTSSGPALTKPDFLSHLNDDCCRIIGSVRNKFARHDDPQHAAAHVELKHGDFGWDSDNGRVDTIVDMTSTSPLVIVGTIGAEVRFLAFNQPAKVVISNIPVDFITTSAPESSPDHFDRYYDLVTFGFFCGKAPSTDKSKKCAGQVQNFPALEKTALLSIGSLTSGLDIDCSNSQYP